MTGHDEGLIAIRAAESDDATREQIRSKAFGTTAFQLGCGLRAIGDFSAEQKGGRAACRN